MIISAISVLSFSTTDQGSDRIGAWVALRKEANPQICCTMDYEIVSTTDQGSDRIGAWVALRKEANSLICCTMDYEISLMNKNRPTHQSVHSPDPLY
ncbi:MAG: hypothetical protein DRQ99_24395 [Candidatus Parabeggiatoa sp. nov. 3]|nr:MAG: hypothetical protein DRQ99_24395 [Gammaproteobacteria bacterium]